MAKKITHPSFNDVLSILGSHKFDVAPPSWASKIPGAMRVGKYGCAAEIAPEPSSGDGTALITARPGYVLGGEIARILDRGYQKFLKTSRMEVPATADHLRAIHSFSEELKQAVGAMELYNQALGTTSDTYVYDRLKGRE
jgi:Lon protease-like protein